jgi:hypothetical protein
MRITSRILFVLLCLQSCNPLPAVASEKAQTPAKAYPLSTWRNLTCRAKGRFQDREYCSSPVIDQIVADGKNAIPVLISQITDSRLITEPVYDYWPSIRAGELAQFILSDLFLDDTWQKKTMPELFPFPPCSDPSWSAGPTFERSTA